MATYTRTFPATNSSITVNYPDGLFANIGVPRDFYREDYLEEDDNYRNCGYDDLLLIPANGVFIDGIAHVHVKDIEYRRKRNETTFTISSQNESEDDFGISFDRKYGEGIQILNPILYCGRAMIWGRGVGYADWNKSLEDNPSRYTQRQVTLTFTGRTDYFKSNADFYFIKGEDGINDETLYVGCDFPTSSSTTIESSDGKAVVSGFVVYDREDDDEQKKYRTIYHVSATSLKLKSNWQYKDGVTRSYCVPGDRGGVTWRGNFREGGYRENLNSDDVDCQGFNTYMSLREFRTEWSTNDPNFSFEGKYIEFLDSPLVYLSNGPLPNGGWCVMKPKNPGDENIGLESVNTTQDHSVKVQLCHNMKFFPFPVYDNEWKQKFGEFDESNNGIQYFSHGGTPHFIVTTLSDLWDAHYSKQIEYVSSNGMEFTGLYATYVTDNDNGTYSDRLADFVISLDEMIIPLHEYGTFLCPVFTYPICTYLKLNSDRQTDPANVCGNETYVDYKIRKNLDKIYGSNGYYHRNVDTWPHQYLDSDGITPVGKEVMLLKKSLSKFKVLYVNCHGAKWSDGGSYACLSQAGEGEKRFHFKHLKYLLDGSRNDEFYFIYIGSCYGAGVFEDAIHEDVNNPNFIQHLVSSELKGNYVIWCGDCVNSPAWGRTGGLSLSDLYNLNSQETKTYQDEAATINQMISNTRDLNIGLLVDFLQDNYQFMNDVLLDSSKLNWTEQTFLESIQNAKNRIIWYSDLNFSRRNTGVTPLDAAKTYPILFLFHFLMQCSNLVTVRPIKDIKKFGKDNYSKYAEEMVSTYGQVLNRENSKYICSFVSGNELLQDFFGNSSSSSNSPSVNVDIDRLFPTQDEKDKLKRYIKFFYDLYLCWNKMLDNANPLLERNGWEFYGGATQYFLDDIPGIYVHGTQEFLSCKFPLFPGYDSSSKITKEEIDEITYSEEKYATGG